MTDIETFDIPAFTSQGGISLDLQLAYKTYGDMSAAKDNVILVTTSYSAQHEDAEGLFAPSERLDLSDYCVVVVNMLCNGLSTSPSHGTDSKTTATPQQHHSTQELTPRAHHGHTTVSGESNSGGRTRRTGHAKGHSKTTSLRN